MLEFGDRSGVLAHRGDFTAMRKYFGDSIKGTSEERVCFPQAVLLGNVNRHDRRESSANSALVY